MGMDDRDQQPTPQPLDDIATAGAPASPDALRNIVAKHQRSRTRTLGALLAVALGAGPVAGWAIAPTGGGGGQQLATGSSPDRSNAANAQAPVNGGSASGAVIAFPSANETKANHLFTRTSSDGIVIRAYRVDPPAPPEGKTTPTTQPADAKTQQAPCPQPMTVKPGAPAAGAEAGSSVSAEPGSPGPDSPPETVINGTPPPRAPMPPTCKVSPAVLAEVSTDAAVGQGFDPIDATPPSDALSHLSINGFGVAESAPATFVTVQTGPGVASVRLRLPDGSADAMAPVNNVAVLAHGGPQPPADGTVVEALDAGGKVLQSEPVAQPMPKAVMGCAFATGPAMARPAPPTTR
jgi:hypothetical protein